MTNKPREWQLNLRDEIITTGVGIVEYYGHPPPASQIVEVVEKSAYQALLEQAERMAEALTKIANTSDSDIMGKWVNEYDLIKDAKKGLEQWREFKK